MSSPKLVSCDSCHVLCHNQSVLRRCVGTNRYELPTYICIFGTNYLHIRYKLPTVHAVQMLIRVIGTEGAIALLGIHIGHGNIWNSSEMHYCISVLSEVSAVCWIIPSSLYRSARKVNVLFLIIIHPSVSLMRWLGAIDQRVRGNLCWLGLQDDMI